jgi:Domain of unknown function (DUF4326)
MTAPSRIQRKRTRGWRMPANTICVTRPGKWGNPFEIGRDGTRDESWGFKGPFTEEAQQLIENFEQYFASWTNPPAPLEVGNVLNAIDHLGYGLVKVAESTPKAA